MKVKISLRRGFLLGYNVELEFEGTPEEYEKFSQHTELKVG